MYCRTSRSRGQAAGDLLKRAHYQISAKKSSATLTSASEATSAGACVSVIAVAGAFCAVAVVLLPVLALRPRFLPLAAFAFVAVAVVVVAFGVLAFLVAFFAVAFLALALAACSFVQAFSKAFTAFSSAVYFLRPSFSSETAALAAASSALSVAAAFAKP